MWGWKYLQLPPMKDASLLTGELRTMAGRQVHTFPQTRQQWHDRLMPSMLSSRLSQGPRQSNTEDICSAIRPPSCEQAQSFALFPFSSALSSYPAFSTCCFHHFSYHRELFSCVAVYNSSQNDFGLFAY